MTDMNVQIAAQQLARMRGMVGLYHKQFFSDVRFTTVVVLVLGGFGFWGVEELFLVVPFIALMGACQTAFDASYLIFARQYAASLETYINDQLGDEVLVASRLESAYLFPLDVPKVVTLAAPPHFTWFGFMTAFYTLIGVGAFVVGLILGLPVASDAGDVWLVSYLGVLAGLTVVALAVGWWWFPAGNGERRLREILDSAF